MKIFSLIIGILWFLASHIWLASYLMFDSSLGLWGAIFSSIMGILYVFMGSYED